MIEEIKFETIGIVGYGRKILKHLAYSFLDEASVRISLNLDKIRHRLNLFYLGESSSFDVSEFN